MAEIKCEICKEHKAEFGAKTDYGNYMYVCRECFAKFCPMTRGSYRAIKKGVERIKSG